MAAPRSRAPRVALAIGAALAVALLEQKGFRREDFARLHAGGTIGRRLLAKVEGVMVTDPLPLLSVAATVRAPTRSCPFRWLTS